MNPDNYKSFYYPPGGILIWIIIFVEIITFGAGIIVFSINSIQSSEMFDVAQQTLNTTFGFANTLILLTSGFFMANAVHLLKEGSIRKSQKFLWITIFVGCLFLILKSIEYVEKINHGFDLTYNSFFTFYWLLTGFHFMHVLTGLVILSALSIKIRQGVYTQNNYLDIETGGAFWHLCDIIWLLLFPVLYLL